MTDVKQKLALVLGTVPSVDDIDQFRLLDDQYELMVISCESIVGYISQMSYFQDLKCMALADYDDNPTYMPGLEKALAEFDVVIVKERLGLYAYQCVKAKWKHRFRLLVWIDNLRAFPGQDIKDLNVIRTEVTNAADGFIVQSQAAASTLALEGIEDGRIIQMTPWVDCHVERSKKLRAKARRELGFAEGDLVICHQGDIEWEEGLGDLVAALKLAITKKPQLNDKLRVVFMGIGSYATQLSEQFVQLGIDHIVSYIKPTRVAQEAVLLAADASFIGSVPSRDRCDGDPYRVLRAMVHKVPIVGCRTPIIEEVCGKHRIDFCMGSIHSLTNAIIKLDASRALAHDIATKAFDKATSRFGREKCQQDLHEAMKHLSGFSQVDDQNSIDHLVLEAESRVSSKQYLDAIEIIESTFQKHNIPTHHKANLYRLIGDCFAKLGDNEGAKDAYIQAAELDPYSAKAYIGLGTVGLVKNICDIAVLHFQKAVSLAPDDEMANLGLGLAFQGMKELKEAKRWVCKALRINPNNTVGIFTLVKISHELADYVEVKDALNAYLAAHPNDYNMLYTLGGIYFKDNDFEQALEISEKILAVDPMDEKAQSLAQQSRRSLEEQETKASNSTGA